MPAFIWITNHRMWKVVEPFTDSWDVLKAYITDPCAYVYWSTPRFQNKIKVGDAAYIFRSADRQGVVARGVVEEAPRHLASTTVGLFAFPDRLTPPGWDEAVAPSSWKTGIRIERTFWDEPVYNSLRLSQGGIGRLSEDELKGIEGEIAGR
jgi:hypothetical protein